MPAAGFRKNLPLLLSPLPLRSVRDNIAASKEIPDLSYLRRGIVTKEKTLLTPNYLEEAPIKEINIPSDMYDIRDNR